MKKSILAFFILIFLCSNLSIAAEVPQIFVRYNTPSQEGTGVNPARNSCGSSILGKLNDLSAGSSVHMLMYSLSFNDLITKLKDIATPERKVCIIVDKGQYNSDAMKDRVNELASHANIRIRVIGKPRNESSVTWRNEITLHEKSTLLKDGDKETLMIGSYNWSFAASARNYENCIFMERKTGGNLDINNVIAAAKTRFDELWKKSERLRSTDPIESPIDCLMALPLTTLAVEAAVDGEKDDEPKRDQKKTSLSSTLGIKERGRSMSRRDTSSILRTTGRAVIPSDIHLRLKDSHYKEDPRPRARHAPSSASPAKTRSKAGETQSHKKDRRRVIESSSEDDS